MIKSKEIPIKYRNIAKKKKGICLSKKYINCMTKLEWQCQEKHKWKAKPNDIKSGHWCPHCANLAKLTIEEMRTLAKKKRGMCLSKKYINSRTNLKWKCKEGHVWKANPHNIKNGSWCPYCSGLMKLSLKKMKDLAKIRKGKCLSKEYINSRTKLRWKCSEGHIWESIPNHIIRNNWCPYCYSSIGENICRKYFEYYFEEKFPKSRPCWLISSKGGRLELDGYSNKLGIAFEYQGIQHYKKVDFFSKTRNLEKTQKIDSRKRYLCRKNNVILITIPYKIKYENLREYIIRKCEEKRRDRMGESGILFSTDFTAEEVKFEVKDGKTVIGNKEFIIDRTAPIMLKKTRLGRTRFKPFYILKWDKIEPANLQVVDISPNSEEYAELAQNSFPAIRTLEVVFPEKGEGDVLPEMLKETHDMRYMEYQYKLGISYAI